MNYKTTIALIVLLLLVGAYFFFVEQHEPSSYPNQSHAPVAVPQGEALFSESQLSADNVDRVTIERGNLKLAFAKDGQDWYQTEPVRCKLNTWSITSLLGDAAGLRKFDTLPADSKADFFATVTLHTTSSDQPIVLHLGESTLGGRAKLRVDDDSSLLLTDDALHNQVRDLKVNDWRSRTFTTPGPSEVETFTIENGDQPAITLRRDQNQWRLDAAGSQRADSDKVKKMISAFGRLSVADFVADKPDDLSVFGLEHPQRTLTLTTADRTIPAAGDKSAKTEPGTHIQLRIGRAADLEDKTFYAVRVKGDAAPQIVFKLRAEDLDAFNKSADDLRDPKLFTTAADNVKSLSLDHGGQTLKLQRDPSGKYVFADPKPNFDADFNEASDLVSKAVSLQADGYDADFKPQVDPVLKIIVNDTVADIYAGNDDKTYVAVHEGEPVAFRLSAEAVQPLLKADALSLRDRTILDLKAEQIKSLTLTQSDGLKLHFEQDDNGKWKLDGYDKFEQSALDDLLAALAPLRCQQWPPEGQVGEPVMSLAIETRDGKTHTLTLGKELAGADTVAGAFAVAQSLRDKMDAEFRPRLVIDLTPEQIAKVTVTRGDQTITVTHENDQYKAEGVTLDTQAAAGLFDTLGGLQAQHFVAKGPAEPTVTLTVQPKDGDAITLKLSTDGKLATHDPATGDYRDHFTLSEDVARKLTATLVKAPAQDQAATDLIK